MDEMKVLLLAKMALRILDLLNRAAAGEEVTDAEIDAALDRANAADAAWQDANTKEVPSV